MKKHIIISGELHQLIRERSVQDKTTIEKTVNDLLLKGLEK